jgi:hypothetical protein
MYKYSTLNIHYGQRKLFLKLNQLRDIYEYYF